MFAICHMGVICIDRNTTAVNEMHVAIKYTFDLAVSNVREQIASSQAMLRSFTIIKKRTLFASHTVQTTHVLVLLRLTQLFCI